MNERTRAILAMLATVILTAVMVSTHAQEVSVPDPGPNAVIRDALKKPTGPLNTLFWQRIHGGSTHFPIVLLMASVIFDVVAWRSRDEALRRGLHVAGFGSAVAGMLGGIGAVVAGLIMTDGRMIGGGHEKAHHLFVWPAFASCLVFVGWRLFRGGRIPQCGLGIYLGGMSLAAALMVGAGYSGGEMLLGADTENAPFSSDRSTSPPDRRASVPAGQQLYLEHCADCHNADAHGDEGSDLHNLDGTDEQIATRIRKGKKGRMTGFAEKLSPEQIHDVVAYLRTLK
ncbi:MAG: c-type cytochrome [Verrucomicrobia subdivision 3 bacterium]|nr:c-type cytochrome [Limisphaerales bacterium]